MIISVPVLPNADIYDGDDKRRSNHKQIITIMTISVPVLLNADIYDGDDNRRYYHSKS
jgi:hypothetical protein